MLDLEGLKNKIDIPCDIISTGGGFHSLTVDLDNGFLEISDYGGLAFCNRYGEQVLLLSEEASAEKLIPILLETYNLNTRKKASK